MKIHTREMMQDFLGCLLFAILFWLLLLVL